MYLPGDRGTENWREGKHWRTVLDHSKRRLMGKEGIDGREEGRRREK